MLTDFLFMIFMVFGFLYMVGAIAWIADRLASFHLEGMARVRRLEEKEREGAR